MDDDKARALKITIVGADQSGKTALTVRFLTGKFIFEYSSGHDVVYQHNFLLESNSNSSAVPLEIVDTSCNEDISDAINGSNGIIIVYAIDNERSFKRAQEILFSITENDDSSPFIALVGNKSDLWPYKTVNQDDGKELAERYMCGYFELSALSCKDGVCEMFTNVIQISIAKDKPRSLSLPNKRIPRLPQQVRPNSLISFQAPSLEEEKMIEEVQQTVLPINVCKTMPEFNISKSTTNNQLTSIGVCKALPEFHKTLSKTGSASQSTEISKVVRRDTDNKNISRIVRRTLIEMGKVPVETKCVANKPGFLHRTLNEVGLLAFSTLSLPVSQKNEQVKMSCKKRESGMLPLPNPLLLGRIK